MKFETIEEAADDVLWRIDRLEATMQNNFPTTTLDYLGADIGYWPDFITFARKHVTDVIHGARSSERGSPVTGTWWQCSMALL